jgi:hypothetical protein
MVDGLGGWLEDNHTPPDLTEMIVLYLRGRNTVKMQDLTHYTSRYHALAILHDQLQGGGAFWKDGTPHYLFKKCTTT